MGLFSSGKVSLCEVDSIKILSGGKCLQKKQCKTYSPLDKPHEEEYNNRSNDSNIVNEWMDVSRVLSMF